MSQAFMEQSFPLALHNQAEIIKGAVKGSLFQENADPTVEYWSDEAAIYTRSDSRVIEQLLESRGIILTPEEMSDLASFSSDYASLIDQEQDEAELRDITNEGETR